MDLDILFGINRTLESAIKMFLENYGASSSIFWVLIYVGAVFKFVM